MFFFVSHLQHQQVSTPVACVMTAPITQLDLPSGQEGAVAMETWEYCQKRGSSPENDLSPNISFPEIFIFSSISYDAPFLSPSLLTELTHSNSLRMLI